MMLQIEMIVSFLLRLFALFNRNHLSIIAIKKGAVIAPFCVMNLS
jgi:hypothetical protein